MAFVKTKYAPQIDDDYPDMEFVLGAGGLNGDIFGSFRNLLGIPENTNRKVFVPFLGRPSFSIATVLLQPKSRGRVVLKDSNPLHWPLINPNYLAEEIDLMAMVEGVKMVLSFIFQLHYLYIVFQ